MTPPAAVTFLWGDDAWGLEAATEAFRTRADLFPFGAPERWRIRGDDGSPARVLGALQERLSTGAMFGSGTLAVLAGVGPLVRRGEDRNALIATLGLIVMLGVPLGRLPGDFHVRRGNFSFYFPLASSIVLSILLTALMALFRR